MKINLRHIASGVAIIAGMSTVATSQASVLSVDFSGSTATVATGYAGFVFANNTAPGTRTYSAGSTGYTGLMDTGGGIDVSLVDPNNPSQVFRMVDRGGTDLLLRDYAGRDMSLNQLQDLMFSGLVAGSYSLTLQLTDTFNQDGVVDVQLSVDGGASFSNIYDNLLYGLDLGRTAQFNFNSSGIDDIVMRFAVGGNLFGATGGTTNAININRIFTMNGFDLNGPTVTTTPTVPEPGSLALLGLGGLLLIGRRSYKARVAQ